MIRDHTSPTRSRPNSTWEGGESVSEMTLPFRQRSQRLKRDKTAQSCLASLDGERSYPWCRAPKETPSAESPLAASHGLSVQSHGAQQNQLVLLALQYSNHQASIKGGDAPPGTGSVNTKMGIPRSRIFLRHSTAEVRAICINDSNASCIRAPPGAETDPEGYFSLSIVQRTEQISHQRPFPSSHP